jgi:hypothetical protein
VYNILIVHCYHGEYPLRTTSRDWLYSFGRYSGHRCFYLNLAFSGVPWYINKIKWDLIIFPHLFTSERWGRINFRALVRKGQPLKKINAVKILFNQDEFYYTSVLSDFINEFDIRYVFTCAQESEWSKIYPTVDFNKVCFQTVLTGYLDDDTLEKIHTMSARGPKRIYDVGYRASRALPSWGRHGALKTLVAEKFQDAVKPEDHLNLNISLRREDTFLGDDWYIFLLQCKYTLGVEGGSSILDADGSIMQRSGDYAKEHPGASFDEIESACFPGAEGSLALSALSPRHMEACATRTCQILVEGHYNGVLTPGIHYVELKKDFSNLATVIEFVKEDHGRQEIVDRAYRDIVESGRYHYRSFVRSVIDTTIGESDASGSPEDDSAMKFYLAYSRFTESMKWMIVPFEACFINKIFPHLPKSLVNVLKTVKEYYC